MFRGFIVVGVAFGVGYSLGYKKGQEHTRELREFLTDLRNSDETKEFLAEVREAIKNMPKESDVSEETSDVDGECVSIETPEAPSKPQYSGMSSHPPTPEGE